MDKNLVILNFINPSCLERFRQAIGKSNLPIIYDKYLDNLANEVEAIYYKTFVTELKSNQEFSKTLLIYKEILDKKYPDIKILVDNYLFSRLSSLEYLINALKNNQLEIKNILGVDLSKNFSIEAVGDIHENKQVFCICQCDTNLFFKPRSAELDFMFFDILKEVDKQLCLKLFSKAIDLNAFIIKTQHGSFYLDFKLIIKNISNNEYFNYDVLALLVICGARDMHYNNFIERDKIILPIDLETLVSPTILNIRSLQNYNLMNSLLFPSLNFLVDLSLVGYHNKQYIEKSDLINKYQDNMDYVKSQKKISFPKLNFRFSYYKFKHYYTDLITKVNFKDIFSIINNYQTAKCRVVIRSTSIYVRLIDSMSHPTLSHNINDIKKYLQTQLRNHKISPEPIDQSIIDYEVEKMINYNIPKFETALNDTKLVFENNLLPFNGSSVVDTMSTLWNTSLSFNLGMIDKMLICNKLNGSHDKLIRVQ